MEDFWLFDEDISRFINPIKNDVIMDKKVFAYRLDHYD